MRKVENRKMAFCAEMMRESFNRTGDKTVFFRHLYIKMMILPRRARD
jgi:hypothetical protein